MIYISPNNEYPRHYGDIQLANPDWKLGDPLPTGWVQIVELDPPIGGQDEVVYEEFPTNINGVMTQNWKIRKMTAEEIELRDAPKKAMEKLLALGLTEFEIAALIKTASRF